MACVSCSGTSSVNGTPNGTGSVRGLAFGSGAYLVKCPDGTSVRRATQKEALKAHQQGCTIVFEQ